MRLTLDDIKRSACAIIIGIDPGTITGLAIWDNKRKGFQEIRSSGIITVMHYLAKLPEKHLVKIRMEDARKRNWFGNSGREVLQGAGSIKRECTIWEEFFLFHDFTYELVAPKNNKTKLDAKLFSNMTGWKSRTNEHERDAAMLVFQL